MYSAFVEDFQNSFMSIGSSYIPKQTFASFNSVSSILINSSFPSSKADKSPFSILALCA